MAKAKVGDTFIYIKFHEHYLGGWELPWVALDEVLENEEEPVNLFGILTNESKDFVAASTAVHVEASEGASPGGICPAVVAKSSVIERIEIPVEELLAFLRKKGHVKKGRKR